jgi:hypothetical protein
MSTQNTSEDHKRLLFILLKESPSAENQAAIIMLCHPLMQKSPIWESMRKKSVQGVSMDCTVTRFDTELWDFFASTTLSTSELREKFLQGLWLGPMFTENWLNHIQSSPYLKQVMCDVVEHDFNMWESYLSVVKKGFNPCLYLSSQKQSIVLRNAIARVQDIDDEDELVDLNDKVENEPVVSLEEGKTNVWTKIPRAELPAYLSSTKSTVKVIARNFYKLQCPIASDQLAWDMSTVSCSRRLLNPRTIIDYSTSRYWPAIKKRMYEGRLALSRKAWLEIDAIDFWKSRKDINVHAIDSVWVTEEQLRTEVAFSNELDRSLEETLMCLFAYGGAFCDVAENIMFRLFLLRQSWQIPPFSGRPISEIVDPVMSLPMVHFSSCVAVDNVNPMPYFVKGSNERAWVRLPRAWKGCFLFASRRFVPERSFNLWPIMFPIVVHEDRDYVTIELHRFAHCFYLICFNGNMDLQGIVCVPALDQTFDLAYRTDHLESEWSYPFFKNYVFEGDKDFMKMQDEMKVVYPPALPFSESCKSWANRFVFIGSQYFPLFPAYSGMQHTALNCVARISVKTFKHYKPDYRPPFKSDAQSFPARSAPLLSFPTIWDDDAWLLGRPTKPEFTYAPPQMLLLPYDNYWAGLTPYCHWKAVCAAMYCAPKLDTVCQFCREMPHYVPAVYSLIVNFLKGVIDLPAQYSVEAVVAIIEAVKKRDMRTDVDGDVDMD